MKAYHSAITASWDEYQSDHACKKPWYIERKRNDFQSREGDVIVPFDVYDLVTGHSTTYKIGFA